jgi:hypothetical protein
MDIEVKHDEHLDLKFIAGDTEYVRLNVRNVEGDIVDPDEDLTAITCIMSIKRYIMDDEVIVPEKTAALFEYEKFSQPYSIEFIFSNTDTMDILTYGNKQRKHVKCFYDIKLIKGDVVSTILRGNLTVSRTVKD